MDDATVPRPDAKPTPVRTVNANGRSPFIFAVDHASNSIPARFDDLGLPPSERLRHIAWDPGALAVALQAGALLDAPVVQSTVSRLVVDCNRATDSDLLIVEQSELTAIPGNSVLTPAERAERIALYHTPYHRALEGLLSERHAAGRETILVCLHSFTPMFKGTARPWLVGLLPGPDEAFTRALHEALANEEPTLNIGWNEPYVSGVGVSYTLDHHGAEVTATMIEIRHDEILDERGATLWAERLARCLEAARTRVGSGP